MLGRLNLCNAGSFEFLQLYLCHKALARNGDTRLSQPVPALHRINGELSARLTYFPGLLHFLTSSFLRRVDMLLHAEYR